MTIDCVNPSTIATAARGEKFTEQEKNFGL
jgi:hypothetical protein